MKIKLVLILLLIGLISCGKAGEQLKQECAKVAAGTIVEESFEKNTVVSRFGDGRYTFDVDNKSGHRGSGKTNWIAPCTVSVVFDGDPVANEIKFTKFENGVLTFEQTGKLWKGKITKKEGENPEGTCEFFKAGKFELVEDNPPNGTLELDAKTAKAYNDGNPKPVVIYNDIKWRDACEFIGTVSDDTRNPPVNGSTELIRISEIKGKVATIEYGTITPGTMRVMK